MLHTSLLCRVICEGLSSQPLLLCQLNYLSSCLSSADLISILTRPTNGENFSSIYWLSVRLILRFFPHLKLGDPFVFWMQTTHTYTWFPNLYSCLRVEFSLFSPKTIILKFEDVNGLKSTSWPTPIREGKLRIHYICYTRSNSSVHWWNVVSVYTVLLALKRMGNLTHTSAWRNPVDTVLSETDSNKRTNTVAVQSFPVPSSLGFR